MALYDLAENCEYGNMKPEMLKDRLVVGIRDQSLSAELQMDSDLTLEKAKKQIRQCEAVYEQQQKLKGDEPSSADAIQRGGRRNYRRQQQSAPRKTSPQRNACDVAKTPIHESCAQQNMQSVTAANEKVTTEQCVDRRQSQVQWQLAQWMWHFLITCHLGSRKPSG